MVLRQYHRIILRKECQYMNNEKMNTKNYSIGLDIGTSSVGWAVVNSDNFKVIRKGNKALWGVRLFEEAKTAVDRRIARGSRRRFDRRRKRIKLLQQLFRDEINEIDPLFFQRMKESFYSEKDTVNKKIPLTKEEHELISEYYNKYPTIYHVRKAVMEGTETDIRLIYLAIHHMIKYRGNFLYEGDFKVQDLNIVTKIHDVFETLEENNETLEYINLEFMNEELLESALKEESRIDRTKKISEALNQIVPKNFISEFSKAMLGNVFSVVKLFNLDSEDLKTNFKGSSFEDNYSEIEKVTGNYCDVLNQMKELYDSLFLTDLFKGKTNTSLSALMVERYNKHKEDLKETKKLLKPNKLIYKNIFRTPKNAKVNDFCSYDKYIHNMITLDEFQKLIQKSLIELYGEEQYQDKYSNWLENDDFMPRITDSDNGKYPFQLNKEELLTIIKVQGKNYPFLLEKIENNYLKEKEDDLYKLVKILSFRIPYYVGPLNTSTSNTDVTNEHAWIKYQDKGISHLITPYNFNELIDLDASAEEFIKRMISHCTYLLKEKAMPTNSILYSKFKVLNELKQISINDHRIDHDLQMKIYHELFLKVGNVTDKKLVNYLKQQPDMSMYNQEIVVRGYSADKKFANNMQSYIDFFGSDGIFIDTKYGIEDAEQIIEWITIFEDKGMLERKIRKNYSDLSDIKIKSCINKRYKGWSSLSKKLLTGIYTEEGKTIMDLLAEKNPDPNKRNQNFMQILNDPDYQFQEKIAEENEIDTSDDKIRYSVVDELATSPANKRGIYQALKIVEEIVDYMGKEPQNICVEMARGDDKKKSRKDNRKKYLQNLYEKYSKNIEEYKKLKHILDSQDEQSFNNEKVFLYFIQQGKSLYSGKAIDIDQLEQCEVDHIIPRTLIKDDSIENKALVYRNENQLKAASLVVPSEFRTPERIRWWKLLFDRRLISKKKFKALTRKEYSEKDIEGFVQRQLVETRQITKHVANILKAYHKDYNVIYLNAGLSHQYRDRFEMFKFRELNDYHHAHDAYLATVLGIYQKKIFRQSIDIEALKTMTKELYEKRNYKELGYGLIINSLNNEFLKYDKQTGEVKTDFDADLFNKIVTDTLYRNDILISKKPNIKSGKFYKETIHSKDEKGYSLSIKSNLPCKLYGSYQDIEVSYLKLIEYTKKDKTLRKLIGIPTIYTVINNEEQLNTYICEQLNLTAKDSYTILKDKIPFDTLLFYNGQLTYIRGYSVAKKTCELANAYELKINRCNMTKYKYLLKMIFSKKQKTVIPSESSDSDFKDNEKDTFLRTEDLITLLIEFGKENYPLFQGVLKKLSNYRENSSHSLEENKEIIRQLCIMYKADSVNGNFAFASNMTSREGRLSGKNVTTGKLIFKSITGIYEEEYEF